MNRQFTAVKLLWLLIAPILLLNGCMLLAGAGAGAATASVISDKRTLTEINQDATISYQIEQRLYAPEAPTYHSDISAHTFNRVVLLVGQAQTAAQRQYAYSTAQEQADVKRVYNEITVSPVITFISKTNDKWLTTKVYGRLIGEKGLSASAIKVVTVDAVVYLMGNISHREGTLAVDTAKQVTGVQRVVTIFNYTDA